MMVLDVALGRQGPHLGSGASRHEISAITPRVCAFLGGIILRHKHAGRGTSQCGNHTPIPVRVENVGSDQPNSGPSSEADNRALVLRQVLTSLQRRKAYSSEGDGNNTFHCRSPLFFTP